MRIYEESLNIAPELEDLTSATDQTGVSPKGKNKTGEAVRDTVEKSKGSQEGAVMYIGNEMMKENATKVFVCSIGPGLMKLAGLLSLDCSSACNCHCVLCRQRENESL